MGRPTGSKREVERIKRERQQRKLVKRDERAAARASDQAVEIDPDRQARTLSALASLHAAYEREELDLEAFEQAKAELMAQLQVD